MSLAEILTDHGRAIEGDLLKNGYEIKDIGHSLSWGALYSFVSSLGPESNFAKELDPEMYAWNTRLKTNTILADIYDMLALINANIVAVGSHNRTKKPSFYPRPSKNTGDHYGNEAIPAKDLRKLFAERRKKHVGH